MGMPLENAPAFIRASVPKVDGPIATVSCGQNPAVWTIAQRYYGARMTAQGCLFLGALSVPDLDQPAPGRERIPSFHQRGFDFFVRAAGGQGFAIGAEGQA